MHTFLVLGTGAKRGARGGGVKTAEGVSSAAANCECQGRFRWGGRMTPSGKVKKRFRHDRKRGRALVFTTTGQAREHGQRWLASGGAGKKNMVTDQAGNGESTGPAYQERTEKPVKNRAKAQMVG